MGAVERTIAEVKPVFEAGLKARRGAEVTTLLAEPIFVSHKKENYESEYGEPDEDGCVDVKLKWTEVNVFKIRFLVKLNDVFFATYTLGPYVTVEDREEKHRDCPGDVRLASVVEYEGPPEFAFDEREQQEFLAAVTPKLPYDRVVEDIKDLERIPLTRKRTEKSMAASAAPRRGRAPPADANTKD